MTVGFWVLFGLLALAGIGIAIMCFLSDAFLVTRPLAA